MDYQESIKEKLLKGNSELSFKLDYKCPIQWADMDRVDEQDRIRFCRDCKFKVYDFVGLPLKKSLKLIDKHNGELCGQVIITDEGKVIFGEDAGSREIVRGNLIAE